MNLLCYPTCLRQAKLCAEILAGGCTTLRSRRPALFLRAATPFRTMSRNMDFVSADLSIPIKNTDKFRRTAPEVS